MKRIDIILNSVHGSTPLVGELIDLQKENDIVVHVHNTSYQGHAKLLAQEISKYKPSLVIAVGGDGTAHEVLNGLLLSESTLPLFTILPLGTGNDFMRKRDQFQSAEQLIESLINEKYLETDIGCIRHQNNRTHFLNIADTGFGGATVQTLNHQRKWLTGKLSYSIAILRTFLTYRKPELKITSENWAYNGSVLLCAFCNGGIFGSGLTINPKADPHDGELEVTLIGKVTLLQYLWYLPKLKKGIPIEHPEVSYRKANKLSIQIIRGNSSTEADGEPVCESHFEVELLPGKINFLIP
jgi:diacylglycerol kinase (ATP)